jgi:hypothetical protein
MPTPLFKQVSRVAFLICVSLVGCSQNTTPSPVIVPDTPQSTASDNRSTSGPPIRPPNLTRATSRVILTECRGTSVDDGTYQLSFKYRFISGAPNPSGEYVANVMFDGFPFTETKTIAGSAIQNEGEFQWDYQVPNVALLNNRKLNKYKITLLEVVGNKDGRTWSSGISDPTDGEID